MQPRFAIRPSSWLAASGLALVLAVAPATADLETGTLAVKSAEAGRGGNDNDNGGGRGDRGDRGGGDRGGGDRADRGHGQGHGKGGSGGVGRDTRSYDTFGHFAREMRGSKGGRDFAAAQDRYERALHHDRQRPGRDPSESVGNGRKAAELSPVETEALIERGWSPKEAAQLDGFRNHGHRVSTMVELARELGYGARVGAMQGNFGTPYETGIADIQAELEAARTELELHSDDLEMQERVDQLEADLAAAIEAAKPGYGPDGDWASADLDVNDDGVVDPYDLEALRDTEEGSGENADAGAAADENAG